jgi:membrane protein involved in colicin uptake
LKSLWDAIVNFVKIYGKKIGLKGDLEMQQASMLYWLNKRYVADQAAKAAARTVEEARKQQEQQQKAAEEKAKKEEMLKKKKEEKEAAEKKAAEEEAIELAKNAGGDVDDWDAEW